MLTDPVEGIFQQKEVLDVAVFNAEGELLIQKSRSDSGPDEKRNGRSSGSSMPDMEKLRTTLQPVTVDRKRIIEFGAPVFLGLGHAGGEALFFEDTSLQRRDRVVGFVTITVDKEVLDKKLRALLQTSILIAFIFFVIGSGLVFLLANGITKPLNRLTEGVKAIEKETVVTSVPVETQDEVGHLAHSFNRMSEALKKREDALKESEEQLHVLSSRLIVIQEEDRKKLSKELHDGLGHDLILLKMRFRSIFKKIGNNGSPVIEECETTKEYIDHIIEDVRRMSRDLSPTILEDLGFVESLRWQIRNFIEQFPVDFSVEIADVDQLFSLETQTHLFRFFQEALTNVLKHAQAGQVSVTVRRENSQVFFDVGDNGKGFNVHEIMAQNSAGKGMGLSTMRERARMMGGLLDIRSQKDMGTEIRMVLPIEKGGNVI